MTSATQPAEHPPSIGAWQQVADGVHRLVAEPDHVTIGLVVGEKSAVLIDCGSTPHQGRQLREAVAAVTDRPLSGVIITHEHRDHWFGLAGLDGMQSWGHESLAERIDDPGVLGEAERLGLSRTDLRVPSTTFAIVASIDLGGRRVELLHLGHGHCPSDVVVHVPASGPTPAVVFAGDLVERPHPLMEPESSPQGWPATLNLMLGMLPNDAVVVPGHGDLADPGLVVEQLAALAAVPFEAERLVRTGVRFADAETSGDWPLPWDRIEAGVATAYAELGASGVRPGLPLV